MTLLLLTVAHESRERHIGIQVEGPASVGDLTDALIAQARIDRPPTSPSLRVERTGTTLARATHLVDADLRSGDIVTLRDASGALVDEQKPSAAQAEVIEGALAGTVFTLRPGPNDIGRSNSCDISIKDQLASRRHARVTVGEQIHVADLGSTNGVRVNGLYIDGSTVVQPNDEVQVGDTKFRISLTDQVAGASSGQIVEFNRPPHVFRPFDGIAAKLPQPPDDRPKQRLPMIAALVPLAMGGVVWKFYGPLGAIFMLLSPVMVLGSYFESRRSGRLDYKDRLAEHEEMLSRVIRTLDQARDDEIASRLHEAPSASEACQFATRLTSRLWGRHTDDADFLTVRIGRAEQPSRTIVELESGGSRKLRDELAEIPPLYSSIPDLPAVVPLRETGGLGIAGPVEEANALARAAIAQLAGFHAPGDLVITGLFGAQEAVAWEWLRWLPHLRSALTPLSGTHIGSDPRTCGLVLSELLGELEHRAASSDPLHDNLPSGPAIVCLVDEAAQVDRTRLATLLEAGPARGMYFIWIGSNRDRLPRACGAVVDLAARTGDVTLGFRKSGNEIPRVTVETLDRVAAEKLARALTPVVEVGGRVGTQSSLPRSVSLVELLGGTEILEDAAAVLDRWNQGEDQLKQGLNLQLRAPVGQQASAPLSIDIRVDGPHALVAGTTGAGKSELLQTYVAALAATHSPKRVTFLLVDYKGGAAFKDCVNLPHTVGLVTDLNKSEVRRALVSLEAELHYRETVLSRAGAKDLQELERAGDPAAPPTLILIVDEFAALAKEVPEFIEGVVDVALRGRSLGIHLVLATQRPAGVITPQIRANTSLRIALRVADDDDSNDVIGDKTAAALSPDIPGRAIAKMGPREPALFQSAYVGGVTQAASRGPAIQVYELSYDRQIPLEQTTGGTSGDRRGSETDLQRLVHNIRRATMSAAIPEPRRPWQPPLASAYDLARLPRPESDERIVVGVVDMPRSQRQRVAHFEPDKEGSLLVLGASGAGKTVLLRTLAAAAALTKNSTTHVYALDFGGRGLEVLAELPHVGSVVAGHDDERVVRLLRDLRSTIDSRAERFAAVRAGSLPEFRRARDGDPDAPRILVLLDGYPSFHSAYERVEGGKWVDALTQLVADGRQVGVHFVLTADRRSAFPLAIAGAVPGRVVFRLATEDEYASAGVQTDMLTNSSPPGRAIVNGLETQVALLGGKLSGDAQAKALADLGALLGRAGVPEAAPVRTLPDQVPLSDLATTSGYFTIGLRDIDLGPAPVAAEAGALLIAGPPRSGKTTALRALLETAPASYQRTIVASARPSLLTEAADSGDVAIGVAKVAQLLREAHANGTQNALVLVDDLNDMADGDADFALNDLIAVARDRNLTIAAASDAGVARMAFSGSLKAVRANKVGLLLQPDVDVDGDLVGVRLPRTSTATWPPGRGYMCTRGTFELIHVGTA